MSAMLIDLPVNGQTAKRWSLPANSACSRQSTHQREWLWEKGWSIRPGHAVDPKNRRQDIMWRSSAHGQGVTRSDNPGAAAGRPRYSPRTGNLYCVNEYCSTITPLVLAPGQAYSGGAPTFKFCRAQQRRQFRTASMR